MTLVIPDGAGLSYLDLQNEVLAHGFDANVYRARIQRWLNRGLHEIARKVEIPDLLTTALIDTLATTDAYALPDDLIRIVKLTDVSETTHAPLTRLEDTELDDLTDTTGRPIAYARTENGLVLYPTPDAAYTIRLRYYADPPDMITDTDVPTLPIDYHDILVSYALSRAYRSEDDPEMSQFYYQEFTRDLAQLGTDRQSESLDGPIQVQGMWAG